MGSTAKDCSSCRFEKVYVNEHPCNICNGHSMWRPTADAVAPYRLRQARKLLRQARDVIAVTARTDGNWNCYYAINRFLVRRP